MFIIRFLYAIALLMIAVAWFSYEAVKAVAIWLWKHQDAWWSFFGIIMSAMIFVSFYCADFILIGNKFFWCCISGLVCVCSIVYLTEEICK